MGCVLNWTVGALAFLKDLPLRFCTWFLRQRFVVGIASLIWFLYRTGLHPRRMAYPCQQAAMSNIAAIFGGGALLGLLTHKHFVPLLKRRMLIPGIAIGVFGVVAFQGYRIIADSRVVLESAVIQQQHLADEDAYPSVQMNWRVMYPSDQEAVVAVRRDAGVTYGTTTPYDKASNPAYQLVWDTVCELGFGPVDNPLRDFVSPGDTVIIKPNLENPDCTQAPAVRPVIDMCIAAGAGRVNVGDASGCGYTQGMLDAMGYTSMVNALRARGHTQVYTVTFTPGAGWSWVNLGTASAYSGSGHVLTDLENCNSPRFSRADSHGVYPTGGAICNHSITDYLLDADVVINMPKIKVHDCLVSTFAIKNWVGAGMYSTTNNSGDCSDNFARVCHWGAAASAKYDEGYGNDFMWRDLANLHRATIYWKNGQLHDTPQRKYLVVMDGIQGVDHAQHIGGGGGVYVQLGTVVASTDPIASSAVTHRLVRWDFRQIPLTNNATAMPSHPWGTNDPAKIRIVGEPVNESFSTLFTNNNFSSYPEHALMQISDLNPPEIIAVDEDLVGSRLDITVTTDDDAAVVFLYCDDGAGTPDVTRMAKNGTTFTARMRAGSMDYKVVAHDRYFNWRPSATKSVTFVPKPDVNADGKVNILDLIYVRNNIGKDVMSDDDAARSDVNADGKVNILDLISVRNNIGR